MQLQRRRQTRTEQHAAGQLASAGGAICSTCRRPKRLLAEPCSRRRSIAKSQINQSATDYIVAPLSLLCYNTRSQLCRYNMSRGKQKLPSSKSITIICEQKKQRSSWWAFLLLRRFCLFFGRVVVAVLIGGGAVFVFVVVSFVVVVEVANHLTRCI